MIQAQNLADRKILDLFVSRADVGIYQMGYTFGQGVKFALSAFEPAWAPFVYSQIGKPDAQQTLARVVTYAWGVFLALGLALAVLSRELLQLMTFKNPDFWAAAPIIPVVVLAYLLHGVFLLTSIGIGIEKRARYYPIVTALAATTNIGANFVLIPRFGMMGAAWATVVSYAVMALMGLVFSQRAYPIPFEWGRLMRLFAAVLALFLLSRLAPEALVPALAFKCALLAVAPFFVIGTFGLRGEEREWLMVEWNRIVLRRS
jgi:O-antigen/teichoic acid export membrane protein